MLRRRLLLGASLAALASQARAWFPHGTGGAAPSGTLAVAVQPSTALTTGVNGVARASHITLAWTGAAPSGVAAAWSGGGGAATISGFAVTAGFCSFWASNPASGGSYTLGCTGTGANTASATTAGIVVSAAASDFASGIVGPDTVNYGYESGSNIPLASYVVRGLVGPPVWSVTGTDAASFSLVTGYPNGVVLFGNGFESTTNPFSVTVSATDGLNTYDLAVSVTNPQPSPTFQTVTVDGTIVTDAPDQPVNFWGTVTLCHVTGRGGLGSGSWTIDDPSGLLVPQDGGTVLTITQASVAANLGTSHTFTITPTTGADVVVTWFIAHESEPVCQWTPAQDVHSSTPATNGYGSNLIGTLASAPDSSLATNIWTSDPSELLNTYNHDPFFGRDGRTYLLGTPSAGTLTATCTTTSRNGLAVDTLFALPVRNGTTSAPSAIAVTPVTGLTNYSFAQTCIQYPGAPSSPDVSFTNGAVSGNTLTWTAKTGTVTVGMILFGSGVAFLPSAPMIVTGAIGANSATIDNFTGITVVAGGVQYAKMPVTVATISVSGFVPDWSKAVIDVTHSACQLDRGPSNLDLNAWRAYMPRFALYPTGAGTAIVTAWYGGAIGPGQSHTDTIALTLTDGAGTYCRQSWDHTIDWHTYSGAAVSVGPGGTWSTAIAAGNAINADPATYAGATVTVLAGVDNNWSWSPYSGSSYSGFLLCPIRFQRDGSTQASFTGTVSAVSGVGDLATGTLTVSSVTGAVAIGDFVLISGTAAAMAITAGSGTTWTVRGAGVTAMSSVAMTTQLQQIPIDFASSGSGLHRGGGFDLVIDGLELYNSPTPAVLIYNQNRGNLTIENCYIHDSYDGVENGDYGMTVTIRRTLFAGCGFDGNQHNIYIDNVDNLIVDECSSDDSLVHEFKARSMNATITNSEFREGANWYGAGSPFQNCQGGKWLVQNCVIMKGANGQNANNGNMVEPYNECAGTPATAAHEAWAENSFAFTGNILVNMYAAGQPVVGICQVQGNAGGTNYDPIRNIPFGYTITNNHFFNLAAGSWAVGTYGASAPPMGSGNAATAAFPLSRIRFLNRLTGCPPTRGAKPGPAGLGTMASSPEPGSATALTPYTLVMTVPTGSPSGTDVTGGLISGYGADEVQLTGIAASVTADGSNFSVTTASPVTQLKTAAALADGIYFPQITMTGTGTAPLSGPKYFPVIVGTGGASDGFADGTYVSGTLWVPQSATTSTPIGSGFTRGPTPPDTYLVTNSIGGSPLLSVTVIGNTGDTTWFDIFPTAALLAQSPYVGGTGTCTITASDGSSGVCGLSLVATGTACATIDKNVVSAAAASGPPFALGTVTFNRYAGSVPPFSQNGGFQAPLASNAFATAKRSFGGDPINGLYQWSAAATAANDCPADVGSGGAFWMAAFVRVSEFAPGLISMFGTLLAAGDGAGHNGQMEMTTNAGSNTSLLAYIFQYQGLGFTNLVNGPAEWDDPASSAGKCLPRLTWCLVGMKYDGAGTTTFYLDGAETSVGTGHQDLTGTNRIMTFSNIIADPHNLSGHVREMICGTGTLPTAAQLNSYRTALGVDPASIFTSGGTVIWDQWHMTSDTATEAGAINGHDITYADATVATVYASANSAPPKLQTFGTPMVYDGSGEWALSPISGDSYSLETTGVSALSDIYGRKQIGLVDADGNQTIIELFVTE